MKPPGWLTDSTINLCFWTYNERAKRRFAHTKKRILFLPTYFRQVLIHDGHYQYERTDTYIQSIDILVIYLQTSRNEMLKLCRWTISNNFCSNCWSSTLINNGTASPIFHKHVCNKKIFDTQGIYQFKRKSCKAQTLSQSPIITA